MDRLDAALDEAARDIAVAGDELLRGYQSRALIGDVEVAHVKYFFHARLRCGEMIRRREARWNFPLAVGLGCNGRPANAMAAIFFSTALVLG